MRGHSQLRKGRRSIENLIYHVSTATLDWCPVFSALNCGRAVVESLRREHDDGHVESLAFVVMPDHLHWLFSLSGSRPLSTCINIVKASAAKRINKITRRNGKIWQSGFYDRAIRREEDLTAVARYIVANPIRAGIVSSVREYPLWDAKWL